MEIKKSETKEFTAQVEKVKGSLKVTNGKFDNLFLNVDGIGNSIMVNKIEFVKALHDVLNELVAELDSLKKEGVK
jgi:hypothetical protein